MAEINTTKQGAPSDQKASPGGREETTPNVEAKTYTEKDIDKAVHAAVSQAGRDAKSFELREQALTKREEALKQKEAEKEAAELAEAQKDPANLAVYQSKQAEKQRAKSWGEREADLTRREADINAAQKAKEAEDKEVIIWRIAKDKGVDEVRLMALSEKFNIEGKENLEELAGEIASGKPKEPVKKTDSLLTSGGGKDLSGKSPMELATEAYSKKK